ncbi:FliM/FliN family flagellar motor switch protein [Neogemmobacter tilapiae]|uniref:Flagellar switch protein FliM n=1 Tax=Neogemmobacter tilapiae TaxID=875041 RepID=A0A918WJL2_9RHOB|nr:FliM/FliN family flagellar motor switch protein [Gemmobacter tilapiae]GHC57678.1 flagellar switch protein FliM [Gemmobacter tilapiae]
MAQGDVIRRKLGLARDNAARLADPRGTGAEKALPLALARAARDAFALALDCSRMQTGAVSVAEVVERIPERSLICLLEGPGEGLGVMVLSPDLLAGLIEVQTLGKVLPGAALARRPTRTDAAMVAGWLDTALEGLENALLADEDLIWTDGFRYASCLDEARPLGLLLEDAPHRMLLADVDVARGTKQGQLLLVLPAQGRGRKPIGAEEEGKRPPPPPPFEAQLHEQILSAECQLTAVIGRLRLPLGQVMELMPHLILPLGGAGLGHVHLETVEGRVLASGRMGQARGNRALRIQEIREEAQTAPVDLPISEGATVPSLRKAG